MDGAGGGGPILDWSRKVGQGLKDAGFRGAFRPFVWQTGLGAVSDECASVRYKRAKAGCLVNEIRSARRLHPDGRIQLIAASAGTAIGVFALEAMGENERVESAILLSSSLSSTYDLSTALKHVRNGVHVFTSRNDALLKIAIPVLGTADRECVAARAAGLEGFVRPADVSAAAEYSKLCEIPWRCEWTALGNRGGHTDCKNAQFVRAIIAPLLLSERTPLPEPARTDPHGMTTFVIR